MQDTAAGSPRYWYSRLLAQPWLWLLLLTLIAVLYIIIEGISLRQYLADRQLLTARQYAAGISTCLASHRITSFSENLPDCVVPLEYGLNGTLSIIDRDGIILAHPDATQITRDVSTDPTLQRVIQAQTDDFVYARLPAGAVSIVAYALIPISGWHVVLEQPFWQALYSMSGLLYPAMVLIPLSFLVIISALFLITFTVINPLKRVSAQVQKIERGNLGDLNRNESGMEEIVQINRVLVDMAERIQANQTIIKNYQIKITNVIEAERQRLSGNLHDETMQGLVAVGQRLQLIEKALEKGDQATIATTIASAIAVNKLVMNELRQTIQVLRPINPVGAGVQSALETLLRNAHSHGIEVNMVVEGKVRQLAPETEVTSFRIAQESISNIVKHAQAKHVTMTLRYTESTFCLLVIDDGVGFALTDSATMYTNGGLYGLAGMQERVSLAGGEFKISSQKGQGTSIIACLPCPPEPIRNP